MVVSTISAVIVGYLLGSIPSAYVAARIKGGVDIRQVGGGNMGALNVMREIDRGAGYAVWIADMAKGILAVFVAPFDIGKDRSPYTAKLYVLQVLGGIMVTVIAGRVLGWW